MASTASKTATDRAQLLQELLWEDSAQNLAVSVSADGKTATFTVDLTAEIGVTSGGNPAIAKSGAKAPEIPGTNVKVNLTLYRVVPKADRRPALRSV